MTKAPAFEYDPDAYSGWLIQDAIRDIMNELVQHYNTFIVMEHNKDED